MKKRFSPEWISSKQPRKQRKYRANASLHLRQKMMSVHLDKPLKKDYKKRSLPVRVGDEVIVMRGEFTSRSGKITAVDMKKLKVYIDNVKTKKVSGEEKQIPVDPSNIKITKLNIDDPMRRKAFKRKGVTEIKSEAKAAKTEIKSKDDKKLEESK